jgi:hypothetical protein
MFLLKIPIGGLLWIVWWAIHQTDEQTTGGGDGGSKILGPHARLPRPPGPRPRPRRGAHDTLPPPSQSRTRCVAGKIRTLDCPAMEWAGQRSARSNRPGAGASAAAKRS